MYLLSTGKHAGLPSLTRRASKEFWEAALEEHQDAIPVVGPKTFYVTTKTKPAHLRLFLQATAWYLGTHFGPNDGMVALEDQTVAGVGTVLAVLDAGHTDLTHRFPVGDAQTAVQRSARSTPSSWASDERKGGLRRVDGKSVSTGPGKHTSFFPPCEGGAGGVVSAKANARLSEGPGPGRSSHMAWVRFGGLRRHNPSRVLSSPSSLENLPPNQFQHPIEVFIDFGI